MKDKTFGRALALLMIAERSVYHAMHCQQDRECEEGARVSDAVERMIPDVPPRFFHAVLLDVRERLLRHAMAERRKEGPRPTAN